jgi:hypothetical protein
MAEHKRQHYVPQFYLRGFSLAGGKKICLLVLDQEKVVHGADLSTQCYEDYFYGADLKLEKALGAHIEGPASKVIKDIITTGKLPKEKTEDYLALFSFVLFQHGRTVYAAEELEQMTEELGAVIIQEIAVNTGMVQPDEVKDAKLGIHKPVLMAVQMSAQMLPLTLDLRAKLLTNKTAEDFITSDHPVVLFNPYYTKSYPGSTTGWVVKGLQVFLPLSPRLALCLYDSNTYKFGARNQEQVELTSLTDVQWLNKAQLLSAVDCVYFSDPNQTHCVQKALMEIKGARRTDKVEVRTIPQADGAFVHTFKKDIKFQKTLGVYKTLASQKGVALSDREYGPRQPQLVEMQDRFWIEVRAKRYKAHEFVKFLEDLKARRSNSGSEGSAPK